MPHTVRKLFDLLILRKNKLPADREFLTHPKKVQSDDCSENLQKRHPIFKFFC
ncbi:Uncharacterized protein dnm_011360 [Desulfonema magnum]|uniref:Uncharacterized protein n=1 Tax=Desulfonema magnum TaxID=45655 RepID=A0A975BGU5_9BACT|nr:Uncharacterized protein dnm_011360 [Desulfonema magnum]